MVQHVDKSLIEKLEAKKDNSQPSSSAWNVAIARCVDIVRQHEVEALQSEGQNFTIGEDKLYNKTSEITDTEVLEGAYDTAYKESERLRHQLRSTKSHLKATKEAYEALLKQLEQVSSEIPDVAKAAWTALFTAHFGYFESVMRPAPYLPRDAIMDALRPYLATRKPVIGGVWHD